MILVKNKIFERNGKSWVSVRDYERSAEETMYIRVGNEWMRLEPWQQAFNYEQFTPQEFETKVGSKKHPTYKLIDYEWKPTDRARELGVKLMEEEEYKKLSEQCL